MILLLIAFVFNILLVRFSKYTKLRAVFTTGNVQVQQAATAFGFYYLRFRVLDELKFCLLWVCYLAYIGLLDLT